MYVIADVGSNWLNKQDCLDSIYFAKKAGADAVKFQLFDHRRLYGYVDRMDYALPREWIADLAAHADKFEIDFLVTPFDPDDVQYLAQFVDRWKVASSDINYVSLLNTLSKTGLPIILSTGASTHDDISEALELCEGNATCLLYCVSDYPCRDHDLTYINFLKRRYGVPVGLSDHSVDVFNTPYSAKYHYNCDILEKHFKVKNIGTPDSGHSLNWHDFLRMTTRLKTEGPLSRWKSNYSELDMIQLHNRRLVATEDIEEGEVLLYGVNFGAYRTKTRDESRISPHDVDKVENMKTTRHIFQGKSLCWDDITNQE